MSASLPSICNVEEAIAFDHDGPAPLNCKLEFNEVVNVGILYWCEFIVTLLGYVEYNPVPAFIL